MPRSLHNYRYHETLLLLAIALWHKRTSAFTFILNQGHCYVNAFLFIKILDFNARRGLSNNQDQRISLLSIIWESWMAELSGGGKLKREKKVFGIWIFADGSMKLWSCMRDCGETSCTLILLNFNYQIDKTMLFPVMNSFGGKLGIT